MLQRGRLVVAIAVVQLGHRQQAARLRSRAASHVGCRPWRADRCSRNRHATEDPAAGAVRNHGTDAQIGVRLDSACSPQDRGLFVSKSTATIPSFVDTAIRANRRILGHGNRPGRRRRSCPSESCFAQMPDGGNRKRDGSDPQYSRSDPARPSTVLRSYRCSSPRDHGRRWVRCRSRRVQHRPERRDEACGVVVKVGVRPHFDRLAKRHRRQ